ncbi:MAG: translation elongation factor Ts [Roseovarius sp.]|nr:translation elongation factor Ts [Roseovarius sp.]MCY4291436.1 translation elongation factor Ts [Roseovarius sp.]
MAIKASQVKELRDATGAGMMDAKNALTETDGNMDAAVDWLRTKGLAKAAKKSGRTAAEGLVAATVEGRKGVVVEVNSETDFVGKNSEFQEMVSAIASAAINAPDIDSLKSADLNGKTVSEAITDKVAKIGENLSLRRMARVEGDRVVSYIHNSVAPGMGNIAVLVALNGSEDFGKQVAMHIAATSPHALNEEDLDPDLVEKERQIQIGIARESGKPEPVIEKMILGRMKKFFSEVTLLNQAFVVNPDQTVAAAAKEVGATIQAFIRMQVGEGIEKRQEDFASEVANTISAS